MQIRVYYEDTDAGGVVYYANYLKFLERARTEFLRDLGYEQSKLLEENVVFVVKHVDVSYNQPAYFDDLLEVKTKIKQLSKVSITFSQTIERGRGNLIKATVKVVCLEADSFKISPIPKPILEEMKNAST